MLPEDDPIGFVGGSFEVVLQGEELEQLGRAELVSPLVGARAGTRQNHGIVELFG